MTGRAAALALLLAAPCAAQETPAGKSAAEAEPAVVELRERLVKDPAAAELVARRVAKSRLIGLLSSDAEEPARVSAAKDWIEKDPDSAARVALGLARDDERGASTYEDALLHQMAERYDANPGAEKNLFNRLKRSAHDSKLLKKQSEDMTEDERREILRALFEGQGAQSNAVIDKKEDGRAPTDKSAPATSFSGYYDRLSAANLRGYSPQLVAFQSALNRDRPPGAPPLVETGKLDYPTLSYPAYAMDYDIRNLEERLRRETGMLAGGMGSSSGYDTTLSRLPEPRRLRLKLRAELAAKARAALDAFSASAAKSKDPNAVTRALLVELGRKQQDAARWIAAAALGEELSHVDEWAGFLTPDLLAAIDAAPEPEDVRAAYRRRGDALKTAVDALRADAERAERLLASDGWARSLAEADALISKTRKNARSLGRSVDEYARVPFLVAQARVRRPRWREWLDDAALRWAPTLPYSRAVAARRSAMERSLKAFVLIASGDTDGAHVTLISVGP